MAGRMNKFLELEKRFEKIMEGIEKLPLKQSNGVNSSQKKDVVTNDLLAADEIYKLSNRVKELESAAKKDSEQLDKLISELQSLLGSKND